MFNKINNINISDPIEAYMQSMEQGDMDIYLPVCHPNHVVNLSGTSYVSGQFFGRDVYYNHTSRTCFDSFSTSTDDRLGGHQYLKKRRLACQDHNAVVWLVEGDIPTKNGAVYDQRYAFIMRACGPYIDFTYELVDTDMLDTAILDNQHKIRRSPPGNPFSITLHGRDDNPGGSRAKSIAVAEKWLDAILSQDRKAYMDLHHRDIVANIVGRTPYSGRYMGMQAYLDTNFDFHSDRLDPASTKIGRFYRIACADQNGFCLMMKGVSRTKSGQEYNQTYGVVAQLFEDKISEIFIWLDTALAEVVLFDNPFVTERKECPFEPFSIY